MMHGITWSRKWMGNFWFWLNAYGRNGIAVRDFRFEPHPGHQISFESRKKFARRSPGEDGPPAKISLAFPNEFESIPKSFFCVRTTLTAKPGRFRFFFPPSDHRRTFVEQKIKALRSTDPIPNRS